MKPVNSTSLLDKYNDRSEIAVYAAEKIASLVKQGLIVGCQDRLNPSNRTTRAEAAVFLYRIYNK